MAQDPVIRYTAGVILVVAFAAACAVVVHGYWLDSGYVMPPIFAAVLSSGVTGALTLLGVHLGTTSTISVQRSTGDVISQAQKNGTPTPPQEAQK